MDMSGELAMVGTTSALALVTAMTTDGWRSVRDRVAQWLGRGRTDGGSALLTRLDGDRELLLATRAGEQEALAGELASHWGVRLQDLADTDDDTARELLEWVRRWQEQNPQEAQRANVIRQNAKASGRARITQVGGNQTIIRPERRS
ncbi:MULTISPECIES: hypothetical protein [Streptomyces]|uniref:hypothetical protein n=1 Tax=Streptomyces TaxID=1883 RepID=UPI00237DF6AA|nr:hypothetical protein [Streptomyces sp. G7(2002)]WDT58100.1 hypothetical protein NUT86_30910 [Streptomyces sp. G7(2002)]